MSWLGSLPHQIPFRAASAVTSRDGSSISGRFLWTANESMPPEVMLLEAMAQFAGGLVFHERSGFGLLTGVDAFEFSRQIVAGDLVQVTVTHDASFGGTHRFGAVCTIDGLECARGRFYLAEPSQPHESA
ncbi:MAG TPA: hypothetical protein VFL80_11175 [Thermoanaerobaculia bacterium]|nr:hypothetical protein [Thermoanaerobaculia bacterium]